MDYLKNHCWCSDSNWGGHYDCRIIVSVDCYDAHSKEDWDKVLTKEKHFSQKRYLEVRETFTGKDYYTDEFYKEMSTRPVNTPRPEVISWLQDNVPPDRDGKPMFAYGSKDYSYDGGGSYSFFFQRRKDAMSFIKEWSKYKKPINYCQYFTNVRKRLNLTTMRYEPD